LLSSLHSWWCLFMWWWLLPVNSSLTTMSV
jgi:hypothetical protein